jgi:hypothetical protein
VRGAPTGKDFNQDGKADLIWHNGSTGATQMWFMNGVTMASQAPLDPRFPVWDSSGWRFAGTGDLNYDGKVDVLWHNVTAGRSSGSWMASPWLAKLRSIADSVSRTARAGSQPATRTRATRGCGPCAAGEHSAAFMSAEDATSPPPHASALRIRARSQP